VAEGRVLDNWIKAYLAYTYENEAPEEYHLWSAISAIAGVIRRKVFFDRGYFLLRPNLYTVLVGPPGRCKKSTSMRISRGLLSSIPGVSFTPDSSSRERLIQDLSQAFIDGHSSMTAYSSEFASLLATSAMDMVTFLTDIYDSPEEWQHRTKGGGTNKIKAPYLNLLGATTPDWIARAMPIDTIGIGLTSRIIFVYQDTPRIRDPFPELSDEQKALRPLLIQDLETMALLSGQYEFTDQAKADYRAWYLAHSENPNQLGDPRMSGYFNRKPDHILKLSMIIAASFRNDPIIESSDIQGATAILESTEERMLKVFANVGKNPLSLDYDDVAAAVYGSENGLTVGELLGRFKHSVRKDELLEILETLTSMGVVIPGGNQRYKARREA